MIEEAKLDVLTAQTYLVNIQQQLAAERDDCFAVVFFDSRL